MQLVSNIWTVFLDTAFWVLLGLFAAGLIKSFISEDTMRRWVGGRGIGAVTRAALFGAPLPLCSCGVLPAALGLRRSGASKEATVSFLISTPETSIDSVAVTYALMGPVMAVYRPVAALVSAILTGLLTALVDTATVANAPGTVGGTAAPAAATSCCGSGQEPSEPAVKSCCGTPPEKPSAAACCSTGHETVAAPGRFVSAVRFAGAELLDDISVWLAVGIVVAGAMITIVPPGWLAQWGQGIVAMLIMVLVGIPMYICAVASTPVAAALLLAGVSPGTVLVFLLVGPATNVASFAIVSRELGLRVTVAYFAGISVVSIAMGLLLDELLAATGWSVEAKIGMAHGLFPAWLMTGSALLLLVLALRPLRRRLLPWLG